MSDSALLDADATDSADREPTRRRLSDRQVRTVVALSRAAVDELRAEGYEGLTVRNVARRAGVAPATAYTYFGSREHLVTEVFWRLLRELPEPAVDRRRTAASRVELALEDVMRFVASEPALAAACTSAMLCHDPDVAELRLHIGAELRRRTTSALGEDATDALLRTLDLVVSGVLVHAGMGHVAAADLPGRLGEAVQQVLGVQK